MLFVPSIVTTHPYFAPLPFVLSPRILGTTFLMKFFKCQKGGADDEKIGFDDAATTCKRETAEEAGICSLPETRTRDSPVFGPGFRAFSGAGRSALPRLQQSYVVLHVVSGRQ